MLILSCDENFVIVKCEDCLDSEPYEATIKVEVDDNGSFEGKLTIYEGNIEDDIVVTSAPVYGNPMEFLVKINKRYTFKVEYTGNSGIKYTAINSVYPRVKLELEQCSNSPCFYIYDNKLNMKLKYQ